MVCKEDVFAWFSRLSASKRIDVLTGLLHMCLPLELRFVGSCVEDLAKRNFHYLREAELKANKPHEIEKLRDISDETVRSRINVYLALLYSTNRQCSSLLFDILTCIQGEVGNLSVDEKIASELLLMMTVAVNHPVFTFEQKQVLSKHLEVLGKLLGDYIKDSDQGSPQERHISEDVTVSPVRNLEPPQPIYVQTIEVKGLQMRSESHAEFCMQVTWSNGETSTVTKTYQELYEFHTKLLKIFPDDAGAHRQERRIPYLQGIRQLVRSHREEVLNNMLPNIKEYIKQLLQVPEYMLRSDHLNNFFRAHFSPVPPEGAVRVKGERRNSTSSNTDRGSLRIRNSNNPSPSGGAHTLPTKGREGNAEHHHDDFPPEESIASSPLRSYTVYNSQHMMDTGGKRIAGKALEQHLSSHSKPVCIPTTNMIATPTTNHRHTYTTGVLSPSPHTSPLPSPLSSPHASTSPTSSHTPTSPSTQGSRPQSPASRSQDNKQKQLMSNWLKALRLHKYYDRLSKYTVKELFTIGDQELMKDGGMTQGALSKLRKSLSEIKSTGVIAVNGISVDVNNLIQQPRADTPTSPTVWHTPPTHMPYLPPPQESGPSQRLPSASGDSQHPLVAVSSSVDSSSTCSEYSSPRGSPPLEAEDAEKHGRIPTSPGLTQNISNLTIEDKQFVPINNGVAPPQECRPASADTMPHGVWVRTPVETFQCTSNSVGMQRSFESGAILPHALDANPRLPGPIDLSSRVAQVPMETGPRSATLIQGPQRTPVPDISPMHRQPRIPIMSPRPPMIRPLPVNTAPMSNLQGNASTSTTMNPDHGLLSPVTQRSYLPSQGSNVQTETTDVVTMSIVSMATTPKLSSSNTETVNTYRSSVTYVPSAVHPPPTTSPNNSRPSSHSSSESGRGGPIQVMMLPNAGLLGAPPPLVTNENLMNGPNSHGSITSQNMMSHVGYAESVTKTPSTATSYPQSRTPTTPNHGCSQCGCHGNCNNGNQPGSQSQIPQHYPVNFAYMFPHALVPGGGFPAGLIPPTSNGMVPSLHNLTFGAHHHGNIPPTNLPNGLNADVIYNNPQASLALLHAASQGSNITLQAMGLNNLNNNPALAHQVGRRGKNVTCYNCGNRGHMAQECRETSLESMTRTGHYQLDYKPKSDSD